MSNALLSSRLGLSDFRTSQRSQHASQDAHLIVRGLAELGGFAGIPDSAGPLPGTPSLVPVLPVVGSIGEIALAEFNSGQPVFAAPLIAPRLHGAKALILAAPLTNNNPVYFSQDPAVRPAGGGSDWSGPPLGTNDAFTSNLTGWTNTSPIPWTWHAGSARWTSSSTVEGQSYPLSQVIPARAGQLLEITAECVTYISPGGAEVVDFYLDDVFLYTMTEGDGNFELLITCPRDNPELKAILRTGEGDTGTLDIQLDILRATVRYLATDHVGTPLYPGQQFIASASEYNLSQPWYVVAANGAGDERTVFANYNNTY